MARTFEVTKAGAFRVMSDWRIGTGQSPRAVARAFARKHGEAGILRCDGRVLRYYRMRADGPVRQETVRECDVRVAWMMAL